MNNYIYATTVFEETAEELVKDWLDHKSNDPQVIIDEDEEKQEEDEEEE